MCEMRAAASGEGVFLSSLYGGSDRKTRGKSAGTLEKEGSDRRSFGGSCGSRRDGVFPISQTTQL